MQEPITLSWIQLSVERPLGVAKICIQDSTKITLKSVTMCCLQKYTEIRYLRLYSTTSVRLALQSPEFCKVTGKLHGTLHDEMELYRNLTGTLQEPYSEFYKAGCAKGPVLVCTLSYPSMQFWNGNDHFHRYDHRYDHTSV